MTFLVVFEFGKELCCQGVEADSWQEAHDKARDFMIPSGSEIISITRTDTTVKSMLHTDNNANMCSTIYRRQDNG